MLSCPECPIKFKLQHLLDRHLKFVHNKTSQKSASVISLTPDKSKEKEGEETADKSAADSSKTTSTQKSVRTQEVLEKEVEKVGSGSNQSTPIMDVLQCPECPVKFRVQHLLDRHIKIVHNNDKEKATPDKDKFGGKIEDTQKTTPKQVRLNSAESEEPEKTGEQSSKSSIKTTLDKDKIDVKKANATKAAPPQIGFNFAPIEEQKNSAEKSFKCSLCPLDFPHKYLLVRHVSSDHQTGSQVIDPQQVIPPNTFSNKTSEQSKAFPCPECPMIFEHKYLLVRHASADHPIAGDVTGNETYVVNKLASLNIGKFTPQRCFFITKPLSN